MADNSDSNKNSALIRALTTKKVVKKTAAPGLDRSDDAPAKSKGGPSVLQKFKKNLPSQKTMIDVALFGVALYVIWEYGKDIADAVDKAVPTEKDMLDMMREQQAQQQMGMGGPPGMM